VPIGGGTTARFEINRRPYPSFYFNNNFYTVNRIAGQLQHTWEGTTTVGVRASYWISSYPDPLDRPGDPNDGKKREDELARGELYANVLLVRRFGLSL